MKKDKFGKILKSGDWVYVLTGIEEGKVATINSIDEAEDCITINIQQFTNPVTYKYPDFLKKITEDQAMIYLLEQ